MARLVLTLWKCNSRFSPIDGLRVAGRRQQDVKQSHLGGEAEQGDEVARSGFVPFPLAPEHPVVHTQVPEPFPARTAQRVFRAPKRAAQMDWRSAY